VKYLVEFAYSSEDDAVWKPLPIQVHLFGKSGIRNVSRSYCVSIHPLLMFVNIRGWSLVRLLVLLVGIERLAWYPIRIKLAFGQRCEINALDAFLRLEMDIRAGECSGR
jgi:hypothetical protein